MENETEDNDLDLNLAFRTIRIGTLKTYAVSPSDALRFDTKRMKFSITIQLENCTTSEPIKVIIPSENIIHIKSYASRGCPVIWLQTAKKCTARLQKVVGMRKALIPSPYYDPNSRISAERYIAIVVDENPIPFQKVQLFNSIVKDLAKIRGVNQYDFHKSISSTLCNRMLVNVTGIADHFTRFQKKCKDNPNINVENSISKIIKNSASLLNPSDESVEDNNQTSLTDSETSATTSQTPITSPIRSPKNVNRARKSIPKSNRTISLETQLNEIKAKAGINPPPKVTVAANKDSEKPDSVPCNSKTNFVDLVEEDEDTASSTSTGSSTNQNQVKRKRPKNPILWKGKWKKRFTRKAIPETEDVYQPPGCGSPKLGQTVRTPLTTTSATSDQPGKSPRTQFVGEMQEESASQECPVMSCLCSEQSPFVISGNDQINCMAFENIDGRLMTCTSMVESPIMMKASSNVPSLALCDEHRERMVRHECCPACGTFCTGGTFLVCISMKECPHRFHKDCLLLHRMTKDCLHCGGPMSNVREVQIEPREDYKLRWVIAGQDPQKMEKKKLMANRDRSARMSFDRRPTVAVLTKGINRLLRPGVLIDTSSLPVGKDREMVEDLLCRLSETSISRPKDLSKKAVAHMIQTGNNMKLLEFFSIGEEAEISDILRNPSILKKAIMHDNMAAVYLLVQVGAEINKADKMGRTPLFYAELKENVELMKYFLSVGAQMTQKDGEGMTCFHHAAKNGRVASCAALLSHDPDIINMEDGGGWTGIVWATEHGHSTMAKYLEYYDAELNKLDKEQNICLHWAALSGNLNLLLMCLRKHCDINFQNIRGDTALHIAARLDHSNCVFALLCWGGDCTLKNKEGKTPLETAGSQSSSHLQLKFKEKILETAEKRENAPDREKMLCQDISGGFENLPVPCVNSVDDCPCPTEQDGFRYVTTNVHTSQDTIIKDPSSKMQSCQCFNQCRDSSCLCCLLSERCWYNEDGFLVPEFDFTEPPFVFECSETCWCPPSCQNRVVQKGIRYNLQIHRTKSMGWSVRSLDTIPRGAFVCEYIGEIISDAEADIREDDSYLFDLENKDGEIFCIDARYYGNVSRFINHLCNPNLLPIRVFINHHDIRFPRLAYFSTRMIKAGEELGFDYGDRFWDIKCRQFTCGCGLPQCKYSEEAYRLKKEAEEKALNKEEQEMG